MCVWQEHASSVSVHQELWRHRSQILHLGLHDRDLPTEGGFWEFLTDASTIGKTDVLDSVHAPHLELSRHQHDLLPFIG